VVRGAQATDLLASGNRWLGKSTNAIDAKVEIWRFFQRFARAHLSFSLEGMAGFWQAKCFLTSDASDHHRVKFEMSVNQRLTRN